MAECLNKSSHDKSSLYCPYDTDEEDDYDEFCDHFTFSVSIYGQLYSNRQIFQFILFKFIVISSTRLPVAFAMDIMHRILVNPCAVPAMHFCFR